MSEINAIVMCGGKCGGTTLTHTLRNAGIHCIHIHHFDCPGISDNFSFEVNKNNVMNLVRNSTKPIYVLDSYRLPIERKISSFFQNIETHFSACARAIDTDTEPPYVSVDELIAHFNEHYLYELEEYHSIDPIMEEVGVPVFQEFDFGKGYNLKQVGNVIFVKLRFQDISKWSAHLSEIFQRPIELCSANLSKHKSIYPLYRDFLDAYLVPESYFGVCLANDRAFHIFNSEEEQKKYIEKWQAKSMTLSSFSFSSFSSD